MGVSLTADGLNYFSRENTMSQDSENKRNRVNLTIPYSFLEKVDQHVQARLEDGESRETANRSAFVM